MANDKSIKDQLNLNFEAYASNLVLNKLTPNKNQNKRSKDDSSLLASLKRASSTGSRRVTPRKPNLNGKSNSISSTNIVTSPVKTLRRYTNQDDFSDEFDTTTTYDDNQNNTAINIPLKDSPKAPIRKGTPKILSSKTSVRETPTANLKPKSSSVNNSVSRNIFNDSYNQSNNKSILPDDDIDDSGNNFEDEEDNFNGLLSDILSPEKHIYPKDNLTKSSISSTPRKASLYPKISQNSQNPKIDLLQPHSNNTSLEPESLSSSVRRKNQPLRSSPRLASHVNAAPLRSSPRLASHTKTAPLDIHSPARRIIPKLNQSNNEIRSRFDSSDDETPPELTVRLTNDKPELKTYDDDHADDSKKRKKEADEVEQESTLEQKDEERDERKDEHNDLLTDELIDERVVKKPKLYPSLPLKESSKPIVKIIKPLKAELKPVHKLSETSNNENVSNKEHLETTQDFKSSYISKFREDKTSITESLFKAKEGLSIYPSLDEYKEDNRKPPLPLSRDPDDRRSIFTNAIEKPKERISIFSNIERDTEDKTSKDTSAAEYSSNPQSSVAKEEEGLGDADNWTTKQWKLFFKIYKKYKSNGRDLGFFNNKVLKVLRCDVDEIKIKIRFANDFKDDFKGGRF